MATNGSIESKHDPPAIENGQPRDGAKQSGRLDVEDLQTNSTNSLLLNIQELTTYILQFLSTASNETLGACVAGLGAITYLVLGRVGLILIGIVGGVVLHATWEGNIHNQAIDEIKLPEAKIRRERGLAIIERVLDWREHINGDKDKNNNNATVRDNRPASSSESEFSCFQPATNAALTNLTDAIIRDYVKYGTSGFVSKEMLTFLGGGIIRSYLSTFHFPLLAGELLPASSSPFPLIFRERDPQMPFSIFLHTPRQ